jgi:hypothetical protein
MRRLVVALVAVAVMGGAVMVGTMTATAPGVGGVAVGTQRAEAQVPGQTVHCGPWRTSWYVSPSGWWYFWWYRWCHNPSIQGGWYVDWAGWQRDGYAGPDYSAGFQYDSEPPAGASPGDTSGFQSEPETTPGFQYDMPPQ